MAEATLVRNADPLYKTANGVKLASTTAATTLYNSKLTAAKLIGDTEAMQKAKEEYDTTIANVKLTFNEAPPNVTYAAATFVPKANA